MADRLHLQSIEYGPYQHIDMGYMVSITYDEVERIKIEKLPTIQVHFA